MKKNKILIYLLVFVSILVFVDQYIKHWVVKNLKLGESFILIHKTMRITHARNYGAAFSVLFKKTKFLIFFAIFVILAFVVYILKNKIKDKIYLTSSVFIISGGAGNLVDRISKGYVTDYIDLIFWPFNHFTVFNFADCLIIFGSVLLLCGFIKNEFFKR